MEYQNQYDNTQVHNARQPSTSRKMLHYHFDLADSEDNDNEKDYLCQYLQQQIYYIGITINDTNIDTSTVRCSQVINW